ncbi:MAG: twin-arginine translocation signal domain-containing protein, partial [Lachnospiraceae bacterium]|nr:twin-arginine translocation signal domain-containing protein [Lachnospiraceae bacterium]
MMKQISRRDFLKGTAAGAFLVTMGMPSTLWADAEESEAAGSAKSEFAESLEDRYVDPDRVYSSDVRWWLGEASNTDEVLLDEIQAMYDGGFRGVELCMQSDDAADDATYAYGSEMWAHKWKLMMNKLLDLGMGVYLTSGTNWATSNVPASSLDPASEEALQVLAISNLENPMLVNGGETFSGILELPAAPKDNTKLNTVYAYQISTSGDGTERTAILYGSAVKLYDRRDEAHEDYVVPSDSDTDYTVTWTAPEGDGNYQIIATWSQGAYNSSSPGVEDCYTTNYFDERGVEALKSFWEEHYLNDPELAEKIKEGDVQLFMDSLELTYGDGFTWWCEDAVEQFEAIKGYDPMPYIIMVSGIGAGFEFALNTYYDMNGVNDFIFGAQNMATFMLSESEDYDYLTLREQLVNDWQDVMTQLYETRMLMPLKKWLNSVGIKTRAQISYGKAVEITEPSAYVDYPEAENLNQYNQIDILRLHTGGAKLQNKVLSTELGGNEDLYGQSFDRLLDEAYAQYAAGFQRVIWHIWTSSYGYGNWEWPGYISGSTGFYRWGNREPSYVNYDELNAHIARVQQFLQEGRSRTDIAFIHNSWTQGMRTNAEDGTYSQKSKNWEFAHEGVHYRSTELQDHGYTYDYISPDLLTID